MNEPRFVLRVVVAGGWLALLVGCSSLFDDAAVTLGRQRPATHRAAGAKESLFGGVKMSLSAKEFRQAGQGAAALPVSGVYALPQPLKKKVASATVSTALGNPNQGSLFDELPNAGASYSRDTVSSVGRYFTTAAPYTPAPSLFEVSGLVLPLSRTEVTQQGGAALQPFALPDPLYAHQPAPPPQGPPSQDHSSQGSMEKSEEEEKKEEKEGKKEEDLLSALLLLERYAPQLAAVLNATARKDDATTTFPHAVQGDFQLALETLSSSSYDQEEAGDHYDSYEDDLSLYSLVDHTEGEDSQPSTGGRHAKGETVAEIRRRRLEDLKLALEIIRTLETPAIRDKKEEFELKLAKSIFDQQINSLSELNRRQRDTLHSLMTMVKGSSTFRNPNALFLSPVKDARPSASRRNSYLPPQRDPSPPAPQRPRPTSPPRRRYDPPQSDPDPPSPPRRRYDPPQSDPDPPSPPRRRYDPPQSNPEPPSPPRRQYRPQQQDPAPPSPPRTRYGPPQSNPESPSPSRRRYRPPQQDPAPPAPPSTRYGPPQSDPFPPASFDSRDDSRERQRDPAAPGSLTLTFTPADVFTVQKGINPAHNTPAIPARSYGAPQAPTPPPVYYIALPTSVRDQTDQQDDPQPPAPPPRDDVQSPYARVLSDPLPLESIESFESLEDYDSWRPITTLGDDPDMYSQRPSDDQQQDDPQDDPQEAVYNYHYHYHFPQKTTTLSDEGRQSDDVVSMERYDDAQDDPVEDMGYGRQMDDAPRQPSTSRRRLRGQSDPNVSSYSSIFSTDSGEDAFDDPFEPFASPSSRYDAPQADAPSPPPMRGYGAPQADAPSPPPMRGYGAPQANPPPPPPRRGYGAPQANPPPPPPMRGYGAPQAAPPIPPPMRGYGAPPANPPIPPPMRGYGAPPANPPMLYRPPRAPPSSYGAPQAPTRFPRSPSPVTFPPAAPPAPPPSTYGAPPANPTPPAPPPTYRAPLANPTPPAPPPSTYGAPPANPTPPAPPPSTYGAPPANPTPPPNDPSPPAPPPFATTTSRPAFIVPPRPPPLLKSHFSVFNKKSKGPPRFFQRAPVVAVGPVRVRGASNPSGLPASNTRDAARSPLQQQQGQLEMQVLRNEQRLRQEQRTLQDINGLRFQIQAQEQQRYDMVKNLYKGIKKEKESEFKKIFYKGAALLGAMSLVPFATGRRKREAPFLTSCPKDTLTLTLPHVNCINNKANFSLNDVVSVLKSRQKSLLKEVSVSELRSLMPPPAALHDPGCLHRSFCRLMVGLEGTQHYKAFLDKYLELFPVQGRGGGGVAGQALHHALQRLTYATLHTKGTCTAFSCPFPDQDL